MPNKLGPRPSPPPLSLVWQTAQRPKTAAPALASPAALAITAEPASSASDMRLLRNMKSPFFRARLTPFFEGRSGFRLTPFFEGRSGSRLTPFSSPDGALPY